MKVPYYVCDVFTRHKFTGNQLAVIPDARGLDGRQMQAITREFNFSESTFVLPAETGHTRRVRIFTPAAEIPFAGHPNIGTAFVLARNGELGDLKEETSVTFEEGAGIVAVRITPDRNGELFCELKTPQGLTLGQPISTELASSLLSLESADICLETHPPQSASVGLPFLVVELKDREALGRAVFNHAKIDRIHQMRAPHDVLLYTRDADDTDFRARMFAPLDGVPEDPATGSANCALAALLTHYLPATDGRFRWNIAQGLEMGRPSLLHARTEKIDGKVTGTWIGGHSVMTCEGTIDV
jgi:trans-2,3-dihydro-3-hydroxyanthranilate isomerase